MSSSLALGAGPDRDDLLLQRVRRVVGLLEQLDQAGRPARAGCGGAVEVGGERGERLELAVLGQVQPEPAGDLLIGLGWRRPPTRDTEVPTLMAGRTPWLNRSCSRKICRR
jgi:hypothetical protein